MYLIPSSILKWLHKNSPVLIKFLFLMHTDRTAVTIQSNKIVSNEVQDNHVLPEPSYRKKLNELWGQSSSY